MNSIKNDGSHFLSLWDSRVKSYGLEGGLDQIQMATETACLASDKLNSGLMAVLSDNVESRLKKIDQPKLFITLSNDKLARANMKAASIATNSTQIIIDNSTPQYCWTEPELYAQLIFKFVLGKKC